MTEPRDPFNPYAPPSALAESFGPSSYGDGGVLATRGSRFGARLIDQLMLLATIMPMGIVTFAYEEQLGWGLLGITAAFVGYQWYLIATTGQSLAKRWLDLKIVKLDGSPVNFLSGVIAREWAVLALGAIPYIGNVVGIVDAVMIFGAEQRCLHDQFAGTKVIQVLRG